MILKDFSGGVIKLDGGKMSQILPPLLTDVRTNTGKMSAKVVISTTTLDRSRDVVVSKGGDFGDHERLPIVLLNHLKEYPAGYAQDKLNTYTVKRIGDSRIEAETFFSQSTEIGLQGFELVHKGVFRGASIGFIPKPGMIRKGKASDGFDCTFYDGWKLIEYSHLAIPDNPDCLILAVEKGLGGKPLCDPLLNLLRPLVPERPAVVTSGWDAEAIAKSGTYKMAEPKECEELTRASTYYVCPHCGCEMSNESIFKDDDGTTRHGPCRGAVVLKPAAVEPITPLVGSSPNNSIIPNLAPILPKRFRPTPRFLPGLRTKAMNDEYPDDDGMEDEFFTSDDSGDVGGDDLDAGPSMKMGAQAHHGLNDILMQAMQFIEDSGGTVDNATAKKTLEKVSKFLGKAIAALHSGHSAYLGEHPDQPQLPGSEHAEGLRNDEEGDDLEEDEDELEDDDFGGDDSEGDDSELDSEADDSELDDEDKPKKKKPDFDKSICEWRAKMLNSYWEDVKRNAVIGDGPVIKSAVDALTAIRDDKTVPIVRRKEAKAKAKELQGLLTKEVKEVVTVKADDEWGAWN